MPTATPVETIDDDDGFDWEAAVREIDVACQATIPSSSTLYPVESSSSTNTVFNKYIKKKPGTSRQSTLDKFVGRAFPGPLSEENRSVRDSYLENTDVFKCCIDIDAEAAKTWIYPVNVPLRDYQFSITKTALFSNTLVAVPTGLGKTLIAAVVMYNFFRWFPEGKIVFAAPSRPLVMQQIEACHNIVGIPLEWTIDMTGQTSPMRRACLWKSKRVFFVTPQVLEKDIQSGTCMVKNLVCLVIDEAHRALGNYSYSVAVRELMAIPVQLRILALTATPGSKQQTIQHVIDNLHISTLEYRNESHPDVSSYVHNRKLELIEVAMGQDAVEINNLLSEVIQPFVARLSAIGALQYRDFQTLSPCELLHSREKFRDKLRQAPPPDLSHMKYGDVEGYFGVLITLYHIRKLLSSHGIRPAYEMLEEKSQQGSFARFMSRNEVFHKTKRLMQQSLKHGAPSPKLSKLTEVLIDHFETNNPQSSRVIIFSNFRGSVRDIMNALGKIGEYVKATEFIGQSSGKTLRGQSQKVQQAVLEKFRAGGYNVIVATSIGEEGLDIMEVDLVICFDANISPLRMIQRMGRTGRKHDGRVVILVCEGSELKGYKRKQSNSKAIGKHMQNGGLNSFRFHSSPRMIPHAFKPEVQFVELSIEQFVRRGKKTTYDHLNQTLMFADKLTDAETELIAKYFHPNGENKWRLSLIAFPHFQAFPSRVHQVMHSFRTGILIDAMQHLQEMSISKNSRTLVEDGAPSGQCVGNDTVEQHANEHFKSLSEGNLDSHILEISPKHQSERNILGLEVSPMETSQNNDKHKMPGLKDQNPFAHSYLFGSDFVSVGAFGKVLILSVPFLPSKESSKFKYASTSSSMLLNCKQEYSHKGLTGDCKALTMKAKDMVDLTISSQTRCTKCKNDLITPLCNTDGQQGTLPDEVERILHTPNLKINGTNEGESLDWTPFVLKNKSSIQLVDDFSHDFRDTELSPRLTSFIKSGVVPESPLGDGGLSDGKGKDEFLVPDVVSSAKLQTELREKSLSPGKIKLAFADHICRRKGVSALPINIDGCSPLVKMNTLTGIACSSAFLTCEEIQSPLANLTNNSNSKDWLLNFEDEADGVEQRCKFRRLRKFGDSCRSSTKCMKNKSTVRSANLSRSFANSGSIPKKHCRGMRKPVDDVRAFIDDQAELSSEACESDDEEDEEDDSFLGSFIDDRLNPTSASTQAEAGRIDMMAIYRRSLLSQSPMERQLNCSTNITPDSVSHISRLNGSGSSSGNTVCLLHTPQTESEHQSAGSNSALYEINHNRTLSESMPCKTSHPPTEREITETRKRKLCFHQLGSVPAVNLNEKFLFQLEGAVKESSIQCEDEKTEANGDVFYDDYFYEGLDLDAVEAQATILLRYKSELSMQKQEKPPDPTQNLCLLGSPSFDLGI